MKLQTYLNFDGTCEEAFKFYQSVFGEEFFMGKIMKGKDLPDGQVVESEKERVMHIALPVGENLLMGSDIFPESFGHSLQIGNTNYINIEVDSREEADRIFPLLSEGWDIEMALSEQFFGYFASFRDKFGIQWMILFNEKH